MAGSFYDALKSGEIKGLEALEHQANSDAIHLASMAAALPHIAAIEHETDAAARLAVDIARHMPAHQVAYILAVILVRKVREDAATVPAPVSAVDLAGIALENGAHDRD